jgi:type IV pilus assembly protein PilE
MPDNPRMRIVRHAHRCNSRPKALRSSDKSGGFTLIELMITVVVVAILAAIAYPSFTAQVRQSRRSDAIEAISRVQQAQERWRANNATYGTLTNLGLTLNCASSAGTLSSSGYYCLTVSGASGSGYTLTAAAVSGTSQASDTNCTSLVATVTNGDAANTPTGCWKK